MSPAGTHLNIKKSGFLIPAITKVAASLNHVENDPPTMTGALLFLLDCCYSGSALLLTSSLASNPAVAEIR